MTDDDGKPSVAIKSVRLAVKPKVGLGAPKPRAPVPLAAPTNAHASPAKKAHDDHAGHDHHDHHGPARERPMGTRPAEDGGGAFQLDLAHLLPGERDEQGRFERLSRELLSAGGVTRVHLRGDAGHLECCVHHDGARQADALVADVRARGESVAKRFRTKTWFVRGMDCAQCGFVIEHVLARTRGILQADVAYAAERVVVEYDAELVSAKNIEKLVRSVGYELETPEPGHVCSHHAQSGSGLAPRLELPLVVAAGVLVAVGLLIEHTSPLSAALASLSPRAPSIAATAAYIVALACGGLFPARSSVLALIAKKIDIETLMVLAAIGAAVLGAWFEGAFLLFLFSLGHMLEHRALDRARRAVESLEQLRPERARVRRQNDVVEVPLDDVNVGDVVIVRPGDRVPLDGVVVDGQSLIDQAALTGESLPVPKSVGDQVFAGTVNKDGSLDVEVKKRAADSSLAKLVDLVSEAEARKSKAQRFAKRIEQIFVPVVIVAAPVLVVALWGLGTDFKDAVLRGLSLLVAASPCALAVSTPAAVLSAVARAAKGGVLIKGGAHLEALAQLTTIALDKTGTLTQGKPHVVDVKVLGGTSETSLIVLAASAEQLSAHPLAFAVVDAAREKKLALLPASDMTATHGKGLSCTVDGKRVRIGNAAMFGGVSATSAVAAEVEVARHVASLEALGRTTMIVEENGAFVGVIALMDTPRPAAIGALKRLRAAGITRTVMLSGDSNAVAKAVAKEVGVDEVRAPCLPEDKVTAIQELMREAPVGMVGDGVNDAPALAAAHVGIAMGGAGSDVALETADVVLMGDDLNNLAFAIELSRAATAAVRQNIVLALSVATVLVVASIGGFVQVSQAVVLHEGSTLLVVLNGLRLLLFKGRR